MVKNNNNVQGLDQSGRRLEKFIIVLFLVKHPYLFKAHLKNHVHYHFIFSSSERGWNKSRGGRILQKLIRWRLLNWYSTVITKKEL